AATRPEWAPGVVDFLRGWLADQSLPETRYEILRGTLLAFCKDPAIQELVVQTLPDEKTPVATRVLLLETIAQAPLEKLPAPWIEALGQSLERGDASVSRQAVATAQARNLTDFDATLQRLATDPRRSVDLRLVALGAVAPRLK